MLVFLDTEYTDPMNCDLVSIGMVGEDGHSELYLERSDYRADWCNSFVRSTVLPQLGASGAVVDQEELASRLAVWFASLPRSVTVACDSLTDWQLLLDALGGVRPANLAGRYDLRGLIDSTTYHNAVEKYHETGGPWHHALHDARAHRQGWLAWMDERK